MAPFELKDLTARQLGKIRNAMGKPGNLDVQPCQLVGDVMGSRLALDGGVDRDDHLAHPALRDAADEALDVEIIRANAVERRERAAEHVIGGVQRGRPFQCPEIGDILDDDDQSVVAALVGADGGIVYAMLKQVIACKYDERMAIMITDVDGIDALWKEGKSRQTDEKVIMNTMRELVKLNPQNQIHAQELYSAVNIIKRMPPSVILSILHSQPWAKHLGDLYFKLEDN